ncbi:uncharacterized protein OGAPODRAFT_95777 [Ogataea polymorpha]|uniref:uncharacterized protein n=1 Tax=Ogataea polymorpha TaxID=460523 RepID=UPI0007F5036F|nr:uncharacterized protein OGAPODRAFT_95777 [Ogataea polymorpha]OBA13621.1 hypothetical protein OGAPODRAFT_95777 [Ogataea polymorpha]
MHSVTVKCEGGLDVIFGGVRKSECTVAAQEPPTVKDLMYHITETLLVDKKDFDVFVEDGTIRPGILVLINDTDWELEGEDEYVLQDGDVIAFTSTLHGG